MSITSKPDHITPTYWREYLKRQQEGEVTTVCGQSMRDGNWVRGQNGIIVNVKHQGVLSEEDWQ